ITSNPSQTSQGAQHSGDEINFWQSDQQLNLPPVASPSSLQQSANLYNFDEDTSHHESSFDDFLTTECSSENPLSEHTTPQELIWEQQFISTDPSQPRILDPFASHEFDAAHGSSASTELQSILQHSEDQLPKYISGQQLLGSN